MHQCTCACVYIYNEYTNITTIFFTAPPRGPELCHRPFRSLSVSYCDSRSCDWGLCLDFRNRLLQLCNSFDFSHSCLLF